MSAKYTKVPLFVEVEKKKYLQPVNSRVTIGESDLGTVFMKQFLRKCVFILFLQILDKQLLPIPDKDGSCPETDYTQWVSQGDYCYFVSHDEATWDTAR